MNILLPHESLFHTRVFIQVQTIYFTMGVNVKEVLGLCATGTHLFVRMKPGEENVTDNSHSSGCLLVEHP